MDDSEHFTEEDLDDLTALTGKRPRKRKDNSMRKAPGAPKRFKSSYICFFMAKQSEVKAELGDNATVMEVSRRSAQLWRNLTADQRQHWDDMAAQDKARYLVERATYTGPWQVPWKRNKKDPSAPKRPMSAFLLYSQAKRSEVQIKYPDMKNTDISRKLGEMWRGAPEEEREPFVTKERTLRDQYKVDIKKWRFEAAEKEEAKRQSDAEQLSRYAEMPGEHPQAPAVYDPYMMHAGAWGYPPPPGYGPPPPTAYPHYGAYGYYPPPPNYHVSGKPMMVLGPNGMPLYPTALYPAVSAPSSFEEGPNESAAAPAPQGQPERSGAPKTS